MRESERERERERERESERERQTSGTRGLEVPLDLLREEHHLLLREVLLRPRVSCFNRLVN
jgi:hypothetical protein